MVMQIKVPVVQGTKMKSPVRDLDRAYSEKVVVVEASVGSGSEEDPVRKAKLYFTEDGDFIGEVC